MAQNQMAVLSINSSFTVPSLLLSLLLLLFLCYYYYFYWQIGGNGSSRKKAEQNQERNGKFLDYKIYIKRYL